MAFNKISGQSLLSGPTFPLALAAGEAFVLPAGQGVVGAFGSVLNPQLASGNTLTGQYVVQLGLYTVLQVYDAGLEYWRNVSVTPFSLVTVSSDGTNYRIANTTGTPVGAIITAAGSGGTNGFYGFNAWTGSISTPTGLVAPGAAYLIQNGVASPGNGVFTITPSAGGSQWNAIVGGAINTTISLSGTVYQNQLFGGTGVSQTASGGALYTRAPAILFTPPPNQGNQPYILPTAVCTISGGAINSVTVTNQGAGLLGLPGITVVNFPGDTTGGGAVLGWTSGNSSQVGSGALLAMWPAYGGTAVTAPPTFTYGGTSNPAPTATAIMNFTITSITNTTPGVGYTAAYAVIQGGVVAGTAANTNPMLDKAMSIPIYPPLNVAATTGVTTLAGPFGGVNFQVAPTIALGTQLAAGTVTTVAVQTPVVGGASDTILLMSI
jgi:hypothetical protein